MRHHFYFNSDFDDSDTFFNKVNLFLAKMIRVEVDAEILATEWISTIHCDFKIYLN